MSSRGHQLGAAATSHDADLTHARFHWRGPGEIALLAVRRRGAGPGGASAHAADIVELDGASDSASGVDHGDSPGPKGSTETTPIDAFFALGGSRLALLEVDVSDIVGEDGGPGERSGLHAFLDREDISTVVVTGAPEADVDDVIEFARAHVQLFVVLASSSVDRDSPAAVASIEAENAILVRGTDAAGCALALVADRERLSGVHGRAARTIVDGPWAEFIGATREDGCGDALERWRFVDSLRQAIDLGSRWVVFAPNHQLVRRRLERQVRGFLCDLSMRGVLPAWSGADAEIRCDALGGEPGGVRLGVVVELPCGRRAPLSVVNEVPSVSMASVRKSAGRDS